MAANLKGRGLVSFGKRFVSQVRSSGDHFVTVPSALFHRRGVHGSIYDKNLEEHSHSILVPDNVISSQPEKYWGPHPQTGVFGPSTDHKPTLGGDRGLHESTGEGSILEQKTFIRPLEDLDKPVQN